jgi:NodT family efflux transporter outer membrane factor (OMF) lipoprotein
MIKNYRYFPVALVLILFQSCFVAKNYERPNLGELAQLYRTDVVSNDTLSMGNILWPDLFTDTKLKGYINEALENNFDIRIALQQIIAAEAFMRQGRAGYFPTLSARSTATHQELSRNSQFGAFFNNAIDQYEFSANLSWEADVWGKIRSDRRAARASYLQSMAAHRAVKTRLVAEIAATYFQLLALDDQFKVTLKTIENRERSLETIKALKDAGSVTQVAVDQTAAQLYNAQAFLVDLEQAIFISENAFGILLGKPGQPIDRTSLAEQNIETELGLGIPAALLGNRPDVIAAEFDFSNAFELTNVARSNFYPSLTLSATGGFQSLEFDKWFSSKSLFATLIAGLTEPVLNKRQIRTRFEVAKAQQEESLLNFKKTLLVAGQEVSNAMYGFQAESRKYEFRQNEVAALRQAELNSELLLNNGFGTYLDLLTARQSALNAELNAIDNRLGQLQAVISLYRALGGGWR